MKARPALVCLLPVEGGWQVTVAADSFEDQERLLLWLRRCGVVDELGQVIREALDQLEDGEAA